MVAAVTDLHRLTPLKLVDYAVTDYAVTADADGRKKNLKYCVVTAYGKVRGRILSGFQYPPVGLIASIWDRGRERKTCAISLLRLETRLVHGTVTARPLRILPPVKSQFLFNMRHDLAK